MGISSGQYDFSVAKDVGACQAPLLYGTRWRRCVYDRLKATGALTKAKRRIMEQVNL